MGKVIGTPKNLEISTVSENTSSGPPQSKLPPHQQPTGATGVTRPPLNQNQPSYPTFGNQRSVGSNPVPQSVKQEQKTPTKQFYGGQGNTRQYGNSPSFSGGSPQTQITSRNVFPIATLNPYQNKSDQFNFVFFLIMTFIIVIS